MRSAIGFDCEGDRLLGTLDAAPGATGLLIVSGGNEVRVGTHRGMAMLAHDLAARGTPVFRFDRRGVGDSSGDNQGWEASLPDITAAAAAFRSAQPQLTRLVALGNCDAALALALFGREAGLDALILTNPWLGDDDPLPPPAAVRAHYARQLADPAAWGRLLRRGLNPAKLVRGLRQAAASSKTPPLAEQLASTIDTISTTIILADRDRTAQQFAAALPSARTQAIATASHSFADAADELADAVHAALTT